MSPLIKPINTKRIYNTNVPCDPQMAHLEPFSSLYPCLALSKSKLLRRMLQPLRSMIAHPATADSCRITFHSCMNNTHLHLVMHLFNTSQPGVTDRHYQYHQFNREMMFDQYFNCASKFQRCTIPIAFEYQNTAAPKVPILPLWLVTHRRVQQSYLFIGRWIETWQLPKSLTNSPSNLCLSEVCKTQLPRMEKVVTSAAANCGHHLPCEVSRK